MLEVEQTITETEKSFHSKRKKATTTREKIWKSLDIFVWIGGTKRIFSFFSGRILSPKEFHGSPEEKALGFSSLLSDPTFFLLFPSTFENKWKRGRIDFWKKLFDSLQSFIDFFRIFQDDPYALYVVIVPVKWSCCWSYQIFSSIASIHIERRV